MSNSEATYSAVGLIVAAGALLALLFGLFGKKARTTTEPTEPLLRQTSDLRPPPITYLLTEDDIRQRAEQQIASLLAKQPLRYEVLLSDWGPDFTGEGDVLPRWRWVVVDADWTLKISYDVVDPSAIGSPAKPFMLGNEPTAIGALTQAAMWVEEQIYRPFSVVLSPEPTGEPTIEQGWS